MKYATLLAVFLAAILLAGPKTNGQMTVNDTLTTQIAAPDTLTAQVAEWDKAKAHPTKYGETRDLLSGTTHDLSLLNIQGNLLHPGKSFSFPAKQAADHLLIVRDGSFTVTIGSQRKVLGPGGVGLFAAGDNPRLLNTGAANTSFYVFSFRSKGSLDPSRAKQNSSPLLLDWAELTMRKTDKGESRPIFSRPTGWLRKIDMHATTLDRGQISHPQHVHRDEEIILMRSGNIRENIANGSYKANGSDLVFLPSGVPHNLENAGEGRCEYFALQWEP